MPKRKVVFKGDPITEARAHWERLGWPDAIRYEAALALDRAGQIVREFALPVIEEFSITLPQHELLMLLHFRRRGGLTIGELGSRLMLHPTSVTNGVTALEHQGLVQRTAHPDDGRAVLVCITERGHGIAERSARELGNSGFGLADVADEDVERLIAVLRDIRRSAGDFDDS